MLRVSRLKTQMSGGNENEVDICQKKQEQTGNISDQNRRKTQIKLVGMTRYNFDYTKERFTYFCHDLLSTSEPR